MKKLISLLFFVTCLACLQPSVKAAEIDPQQLALAQALQAQQSAEYQKQVEAAQALQAQQLAAAQALQAQQAAEYQKQVEAAQALQAQQLAAAQALQAQQLAAAQELQKQQLAAAKELQKQQEANAKQLAAVKGDSALQAQNLAANCADFVYVDISDQMMYCYKGGQLLVASPCVTGLANGKRDTTIGIHKIIFKDLDRNLRGSYGTSHVDFWMRFTGSGQGLHDASWRRNFGGNIYLTNGSHGCVNLPRNVAQILYANTYVGMPVIVMQ